jgi:polyisoprenoid-binding protein YceI
MMRSWVLRAAAALIVLVVAAAAGWWFFIREDNELATSAPEIPKDLVTPTSAPSTASASSSPAPGAATAAPAATRAALAAGTTRWVIAADRSEAAYFADEKLASLSLPSTAKGVSKEITGEFFLTADGLDSAQVSSFTVGLKTLKSDESRRDQRVQGTLETSKFPSTTFTATKVTGFPKELTATEQSFQLTGTMDLRGVKKELTWEVKIRREGNVLTALATVNFRYDLFGITPPNIGGFVSVNDDVTLQMQVIATAQ